MKTKSRKTVLRVSLMAVFILLISASMLFIFAGNNDSLDVRLANMNVTTISTVVRGARTVTAGNALVITGGGRVEGNITVNSGALLVVEGNPSPVSGNGDRAIQGRVILNGGDFYMLSGGLWNPAAMSGFTVANPTVTINNGSNFTMRDGVIRGSNTNNNSTFGVDVVSGHFIMEGGTVLSNGTIASPVFPSVRLNASGNGTFTMNGGTLLLPSAGTTTVAVSINGGTFYMNGGSIRSNRVSNMIADMLTTGLGVGVRVRGNNNNTAAFVMNGGEIYNAATGVEVFGQNGVFTMSGGTIRDNYSTSAAGVDLSSRATFIMHGGAITNNRTTGSGAGVRVVDIGTTFTMYGGTISYNNASGGGNGRNNRGGGVAIRQSGHFYMYGGYIENNIAGAGGGVCIGSTGVLVNTGVFSGFSAVRHQSYMKLDGGVIRNNEAAYGYVSYGGGGVALLATTQVHAFALSSTATLDMYSGYITGNRASSRRGGGGNVSGVGGGGVSLTVGAVTVGAARMDATSVFNMHGGTISNNLAYCDRSGHNRNVMGGGVHAVRPGTTFNMFDGAIEGNSSIAGGGVALSDGAHANMYDGIIRGNQAFGGYSISMNLTPIIIVNRGNEIRGGGGVYLHNSMTTLSQDFSPTFDMHGGSIIENTSPDGGGIFWMCSAHSNTLDFDPNSHFDRGVRIQEFPLSSVMISENAVVQNNIALHGTLVDNALWGRHRAEDPTVNWGGYVVTRSVPAPNGGSFNHLFNNHDIRTRTGEAYDPYVPGEPPVYHRVAFYIVNPQDGEFGCGNNPVILSIRHGQPITADLIPSVYAYWVHDFTGWGYSNGDPVSDPVEGRIVTGDMIFIALFEPVYYTIYFRSGEGGIFYTGTNMISRDFRRGHIIGPNDIPLIETFPNFQLSGWTPWNPSGMMVLSVYDGQVFTAIYTHNRRVTFHAEAGGYLSFGYEYVENGETLEYYQIPTPYA
ncbi:MAG: hypothetical protein FWC73_14430, partial [Defluviitaleaceae bacterium]|nr:hypothetical protein [Defluviitaleaceae bacterium]